VWQQEHALRLISSAAGRLCLLTPKWALEQSKALLLLLMVVCCYALMCGASWPLSPVL
jgi:hypothetical protein